MVITIHIGNKYFFFFLISKKNYIKTSGKQKDKQRVQRRKQKRRRKEENKKTSEANKELITKKRTKKHRDRITRGESPSPRPIKKRATKISEQLVIGFVPVLKSTPVTLPPNTPHKTQQSQIPNSRRVLSEPVPPTKKRICNRSWQDPRNPKRSKNQAPQLKSFSTMKKQMIHRLPITSAHNAPVNKIEASTPQNIPCKNLFPGCRPNKEGDVRRRLNLPNTFPRKDNRQGTSNLIIERADVKIPFL